MKHPTQLQTLWVRIALGSFVLGLLWLTGCASASYPRDSNTYNNRTGYPAVGTTPWHL